MKCPKCNSGKYVKSAKTPNNKQRYLCKKCGCRFISSEPRGKSEAIKKLALHLYLEGSCMRSIGRVCNVSQVAVFNWVRAAGEKLYKKHLCGYGKNEVKVMEIDELATYIQSKKNGFGYGLLMIEFAEPSLPSKLVLVNTERLWNYSGR